MGNRIVTKSLHPDTKTHGHFEKPGKWIIEIAIAIEIVYA